jgi:flagellar motility protein MotE (MotC chaperone)
MVEENLMPKGLKIALIALIPLVLLLAVAYALAKFNVIPVRKMAQKKPLLRKALALIGLNTPKLPARQATAAAPPPDPLAAQKRALQQQQEAFAQERQDWEAQKQREAAKPANGQPAAVAGSNGAATEAVVSDPRSVARMASVYEQMPAETVTKIFEKLPDAQVLALLRKMEDKQVAQILAIVAPERAARLTQALSQPPPVERTASAAL